MIQQCKQDIVPTQISMLVPPVSDLKFYFQGTKQVPKYIKG